MPKQGQKNKHLLSVSVEGVLLLSVVILPTIAYIIGYLANETMGLYGEGEFWRVGVDSYMLILWMTIIISVVYGLSIRLIKNKNILIVLRVIVTSLTIVLVVFAFFRANQAEIFHACCVLVE